MKRSNQNIFFIQLIVFLVLFSLNMSSYCQTQNEISVTGTVYENNSLPLPGASITVSGTTEGTITDGSGKFTISCHENDTLIISFMGYSSKNIIARQSEPMIVYLEEDFVALNEIVVVGIGYGTMRKSDLTGSIASVSSEDLKKGVISSTEQLLQGKVAGLTVIQGSGDPTSGSFMRLRGGTSLTASNSPLVVVDGIPGVDINTVQPSEIISFDILKDASATAIYGSRGANGVIIVTTSRKNKSPLAEYSSYVAVGRVANHLDLLSSDQWRKYVREDSVKKAVDYGADTDWQKELERTSVTHSHTLSFNNGDENSGFRVSFNYFNNEGIIERSKLERMSGSISSYRHALNDKLKFDFGIHGNNDKWNPVDYRIFERMYNLNPTIPVSNPDGTFTSVSGTNTENPVEINTNRTNDNSRNRLLAYGKGELELLKGLKGVVNVSYEYNSFKGNLYKPTYAIMEGLADGGYAQKTLGEYNNLQIETYLTYETKITESHSLNLLGGYSFLENTYEGFGSERRGFDSDLFTYNNLASGQDFRAGDVYSYKGMSKLISFFGRLNYNYKGKYMLTGTLREDGSTRFGKNNKWGLFPSFSAAWRISDENFMSGLQSYINNFKLRAGYGVTGNQDGIGEYRSLEILGAGNASYYDAETETWKQSFGVVQNANPDLKWESTAQTNIGLDMTLLNKLTLTIEAYHKKTSDLLYTYEVPQPPYLTSTMLANVGDLINKGLEITLDAKIIQTTSFSWDLNFNAARNIQVIDRLSNQKYETDIIYSGSLHNLRGMSNQFSQVIKEGYPVGTFWGPEFGEINEDGKFIDKQGNLLRPVGKSYPDSLKTDLGNAQPKFIFGLSTGFSYLKFDLQISTYGMLGQKVLNATAMSLSDPTRLPAQNVPDNFLETGIKDNPTYSSYWIEDASFLRLQTVTIGYTLNTKTAVKRLRLYLTGENLFVFTKYSGADPEINTDTYVNGRVDALSRPGIDMFNYYPKARVFTMGLNLSF